MPTQTSTTGSDFFTSRWGVIVAGIGMAVGAGNLWRFPRIAAENGGGAFLIPWLIFLFAWSIPLLIAEFGLGRGARRGPIGAFAALVGRHTAWMGGFVVVTTVMIMFYYSVVTGWALKYFTASLAGDLASGADPGAYWETYSNSIWQPILFHVAAIAAAGTVVARGVTRGIERANRILIPTLFVLLLLAVTRAVTLPGAEEGLRYLFVPDLARLADYRTWLEALTQSAWSTGAGWGLLLSYAVYVRCDDDVVTNAVSIGLGNNLASILAAMAILPAVFAILPTAEALDAMAAGNTGLSFIWIPQVFALMPAGEVFLPLFFLTLFFAALSSLIAMVELAVRVLLDGGLPRKRAVSLVVAAAAVCGMPSAASLQVFDNQDWVWGLALMVSGVFIAVAVIRYGAERFRTDLVNTNSTGRRAGSLWSWVLTWLVPIEFVVMFAWWMYQSATVYDPEGWWHPIRVLSIGTCVAQWGIALTILWLGNRSLAERSLAAPHRGEAV
ncbi:MAG: sodium-dependent transporter [Acidobacteria bacterium]|nr:sodium-dependent transporter [Acidobacteriota bacterium]MYJ03738.1 sodium-dependent transporter [Acidobacteriota bacterium]